MPGHHPDDPGPEQLVSVDVTLEQDIGDAEQAIEAYLRGPDEASRHGLLLVLERLDRQVELGDAYEDTVVGSGALGYSTKGSVVGETSSSSAAEDIPGLELQLQTELIRAAKKEVTRPTADTMAVLRSASQELALFRNGPAAAR
jgi:hypothetical protein